MLTELVMLYMKRLKISSLFDNVHFLFILLILSILSLNNWYYIFLCIFYLFFIYKKTKLFNLGVVLCLIICLSNFKYYIKPEGNEFFGTVVQCDTQTATIKTKRGKVLIYHEDILHLGDSGYFSVSELKYDSPFFDYSDYLLNKNIKKHFKLQTFEVSKNRFVIGKIQMYFVNKLNSHPSRYTDYIKTLVFAFDVDSEVIANTQKLGISHIMAVSGMHISLLILFVEFILKKLFYFEKPVDILVTIFLVFYLFVTNFELTVLRAVLMVLFRKICKRRKWLFTPLDILSFVGIVLLIINPRSLFLLSFQLSFIVSFIIVIFASNFQIKNKLIQTYFISLISFLVTFPFILNTNYEVNLLSILVGPIYVLFFEFILYPATLILFVFEKLHLFLEIVYVFFESTLGYFSSLSNFNLIFGRINPLIFILYEIILFFLLVSIEIKRGRVLLTILFSTFLLLIYNKEMFNPFYQIKMYDVGQGDSFLISMPHGQGNILVDCYNNISDYLKRDGIKDIDLVFISHGHSDHSDAFLDVCSTFHPKHTYTSYYDETENLNRYKNLHKIELLKSGDNIIYKGFEIKVLGPIRNYQNENDDSLVLQICFNDTKALFMGDVEEDAERDIVDRYGSVLESQILKASHHGSRTSSSKKFIDLVNPKIVLISVKKGNSYGFPNNIYLLTKNVYRTDVNGSIKIYIRKRYYLYKNK